MRKIFYQLMGSIVCCLGMVQLAAAADATMPFKYRNTVNGVTIDGSEAFIGVAYQAVEKAMFLKNDPQNHWAF